MPYFKAHPDNLDVLRDVVNGLVSNAITIIKDVRQM